MQKMMGVGDVDMAFLGTRARLRIVDPTSDPRVSVDSMHAMHRRHRDTPERKADRVRLYQVFDNAAYRDAPLEYEYDFGDCWEHAITVVGRADAATDYFRCLDGEGHGVAEDVGGTKGWEALKAAYRADRPSREQREKMVWFERQASNEDRRGLRDGWEHGWPKSRVNARLGELAGRAVGFT